MPFELLKVPFYKAVDLFENEKYQEAFEEFVKCAKMGNLYAPFYIRHLVQNFKELKISAAEQTIVDGLKELFELIPMEDYRPDAWFLASTQIIKFKAANKDQQLKIIKELEMLQSHAPNAFIFLAKRWLQFLNDTQKIEQAKDKKLAAIRSKVTKLGNTLTSSANVYTLVHLKNLNSNRVFQLKTTLFDQEITQIEKAAMLAYLPKGGELEHMMAKFYSGPHVIKSSPFEANGLRKYQWHVSANFMGNKDIQFLFAQESTPKPPKEKFQWLELAARNGEAQAQVLLALHYRDGNPYCVPNDTKARILAEQALTAHAKNPILSDDFLCLAYNMLGVMHEAGRGGLKKDDVQALIFYQKQAGLKNPLGAYNVGVFYEHGRGDLKKDTQQAINHYLDALKFQKTSPKMNENSCIWIHQLIGEIYLYGREDFKAEPEKAAEHLKIASKGDTLAKRNYGTMLYEGNGVPKDEVQGLALLLEAAEQGEPHARWDIAMLYTSRAIQNPLQYGLTTEKIERYILEQEDSTKKYVWLAKFYRQFCFETKTRETYEACLMADSLGTDDVHIHYLLGCFFELDYSTFGIPRDEDRALKYYSLAADKGFAGALTNKGHLLMSATTIAKDYKEGEECLKKALAMGEKLAAYNLYCIYRGGIGVPRNLDTAVQYLLQAEGCEDVDIFLHLGIVYWQGSGGVTIDLKKAEDYSERSYRLGNSCAAHNLAQMRLNAFAHQNKPLVKEELVKFQEILKVGADQGYAIDIFLHNIVTLMLDPSAIAKVIANLKAAVQVKPHKRSSETIEYLENRKTVRLSEILALGFTNLTLAEIRKFEAEAEAKVQVETEAEKESKKTVEGEATKPLIAKPSIATDSSKPGKPDASQVIETAEQRSLRLRALRLQDEMDWFRDPKNRKAIRFRDFNWLMGRIIKLDEVEGSITHSKSSNVSYKVSAAPGASEATPKTLPFMLHPVHASGKGMDATQDRKRAQKQQQYVATVARRVFE